MSPGMDSTEELLRTAITEATREEEDDDAYTRQLRLLQQRDPGDVWALLQPLTSHADPRVRELVPDVLRFLGGAARPLAGETVSLFGEMLRHENSPSVIAAIGFALGEVGAPMGVALMIPFTGYPDTDVRQAVVAAMLAQRDPCAIDCLVELSRDAADSVRDWATFGLGSQLGEPGSQEGMVDTPALRDALAARLQDSNGDARSEAMVGLAMRRDERVLPPLKEELETGSQGSRILEAARWIGSPALCEALRRLAATSDPAVLAILERNGLREALAACCGAEPCAG